MLFVVDNFLFCLLMRFGKDVRVVHFVGSQKPWHMSRESVLSPGADEPLGDAGQGGRFIRTWWKIFGEKLEPVLQAKESVCMLKICSAHVAISKHAVCLAS